MSTRYDVSQVLPDDMLTDLPAGTNVLVTGPAMTGKKSLAIQLLAAGHEEGDGILCVTTKDNAASLLDEFEAQIPSLDRDRVGIVNCSGSDAQETIEAISTESVSSPGDLTGISIGTAKLLQQFRDRDVSTVRHGLVSLSTLLQYLELDTVFKFLHVYTARIEDTGGLGIFTLESGAHDPQIVNTIVSEFDGALELREDESGGREIRLKGFSDAARTWRSFE